METRRDKINFAMGWIFACLAFLLGWGILAAMHNEVTPGLGLGTLLYGVIKLYVAWDR